MARRLRQTSTIPQTKSAAIAQQQIAAEKAQTERLMAEQERGRREVEALQAQKEELERREREMAERSRMASMASVASGLPTVSQLTTPSASAEALPMGVQQQMAG